MRFVRKTRYEQDVQIFEHRGQWFWYGLLGLVLLAAPVLLDRFYLGELTLVFIYAIAGIGLMLLVGYTGLVSLGHAAFLAIGAYGHTVLLTWGWPWPVALGTSALATAAVGALVGLPALRMTGIYLAVATLAFAVIVEQVLVHWESVTGGFRGLAVPRPAMFGVGFGDPVPFYFVCVAVLLISMLAALNILRSSTGRAMVAVRDSEISAQSMGIHLARTKTLAFAVSAGFTGLAGGLFAHKIGYLAPDGFTLITSIQLLVLVVVGGLGSLHGVVFGAIFIGLLPQAIAVFRDTMPAAIGQIPGLEPAVFGLVLVLVLMFEPLGIYGRWRKVKQFFDEFPLYRHATHRRQRNYLRTERLH